LAIGVFLPKGCRFADIEGPTILITPKRMEAEARAIARSSGMSSDKAFKSLFKATLAHELGHAYSYTLPLRPRYQGPLKAVEETFAQLFSYRRKR